MDLCRHCHGFAWAVSQGLKQWPGLDSFMDVNRLRAESQNCRLCKMIYDYTFADTQKAVPYQVSDLFYMPPQDTGIPLSYVRLPNRQGSSVELAVWSDEGSAAALSGKFCTVPPLPSDNCPEAFDLIRSWIQRCSQGHDLWHDLCKGTLSKSCLDEVAGPKLPTRILDVGPLNHESVSLFETNGQRGEFCALSYCWGPEGTQTLMTTRDTIKDHRKGIQFSSLPKTFQDAVVVTRQLGIRYLWIDSLCIIQGDKDDWMKESANMAGVYQEAYLVIAASGAANPRQGCFSTKRRCPTAVEVPYYLAEGQTAGSIKLSIRIYGDESPSRGPLAKRGWVLQEWTLARRALHYMPEGMSWRCKTLESGERYHYDIVQYSRSWEKILRQYSECKLTHKEDRLVALEGLAQARLEETRDNYSFGVFESRILEQLLWMMDESGSTQTSEDLTNVPHWSWASKGGSKIFWVIYGHEWQPIYRTRAVIEATGVLRVDGFVAQSTTSIAEYGELGDSSEQMFHNLIPSFQPYGRDSFHWIQTKSGDTQIIGVAVFDREHHSEVHILFLKRWSDCEEWVEMCIDEKYTEEDMTLYAVLLLIPSDDGDGCFQRVGMGFVIPGPETKEVSAVHQTIRLI